MSEAAGVWPTAVGATRTAAGALASGFRTTRPGLGASSQRRNGDDFGLELPEGSFEALQMIGVRQQGQVEIAATCPPPSVKAAS